MVGITRRAFLKGAALAGAGLASFPTLFVPRVQASWARKTIVHPNVDNLRVVGVSDPSMTRGIEPRTHWARQEELVVPKVVWENMDRLACALTETRNPEEAWRSIFVKPPGKPWSETVVAIKTNHIARQHTRSPVIAKICHALTEVLGVKAPHVHIYDACHGAEMAAETPFRGLPEGVRIEGTWGGSEAFTAVSEPWKEGGRSRCLGHLVHGAVDILVNVSLCKGHSSTFGGFTMTMKNHFGTFSPGPGHQDRGMDYLLAINQTPEILGPMDPRTGRVLYPRQQLCVVDALWSSKHGPGGHPSDQTNYLAMGALSPVVDYLMATRFRGEKMGWQPNLGAAHRMLTEFGYGESDLLAGGRIIEI